MEQKNGTAAEVRELPSGFWAVFIDGSFVDASSTSEKDARDKLKRFLRNYQNGKKEKIQ